jgi:anti-anti-sigma factor
MPIETVQDGSLWTIRIKGRFDSSRRAEFRAAYAEAPANARFVVDLAETDYVDSAALGMLLMLRDQAQDASRVTLTGTRGQPEQVLKVANFHKLFRFG